MGFLYDRTGRRLSKTSYLADRQVDHENYLYDGLQEIGAFTADGEPKNLRVTGSKQDSSTVAIELEEEDTIPFGCTKQHPTTHQCAVGSMRASMTFPCLGRC